MAQLRTQQLLDFLSSVHTEGHVPALQPTFADIFYAPPPDPRGSEGVKRDLLAKLNT